ncbi:MAG: hypothetical protein JW889_03550 [Verrucomicrobia bacterium]|nr:hypothetical protein [Verrucomicrobiota bacterium]
MSKTMLVWLAVCVGWGITGAWAAGDKTDAGRRTRYHSDKFGFSVGIPEGWTRIPDAELQQALRRIFTDKMLDTATVELAMQKRAPEWFVCPYAWLQVEEYPTGYQPSERGMRQFIKSMAQLKEEDVRERVREGAHEAVRALRKLKIDFDPETRTFSSSLVSTVEGVGRVRTCMYGWFGYRSMVTLAFYVLDDEFEQSKPSLDQIRMSFEFDPGMEYQVVDWFASPVFAWTLIVVASSVIALVLRRR